MMTVTQVVSAVRRRLPDADATWLLTLVNQIHRRILSEIPEARRDTIEIELVAGQQEYALGETAFQIDYAALLTAAHAGNDLNETSVEALNDTEPGWRFAESGDPDRFYLSSMQSGGVNTACIGLVPAPSTSTSGTYPKVVLFGSMLQASDLVGTDTVLATLHSAQAYIEGASALAAQEIRPQMASAYQASFEAELQIAKRYVRTRLEGLKSAPKKNIRGGGYQVEVK